MGLDVGEEVEVEVGLSVAREADGLCVGFFVTGAGVGGSVGNEVGDAVSISADSSI